MNLVSLDKAKKLTTKRLLAYYKKHGNKWKGRFYCRCCGEPLWEIKPDGEHYKKEYEDLESYWNSIKNILNAREHIEIK